MSIFDKLKSSNLKVSELFPSEWAEKNRMMTKEVSNIPGYFSYENSPYMRELVDCVDSRTPGNVFAFMKSAQVGGSTGLIENAIGWIISNDPGNILFLVGHANLVPDAVQKVDIMIHNSGLSDYIGSNSKRKRNTKSGNTDKFKEFPMGKLKIDDANHKKIRNFSVKYGFIDDFESMKGNSEDSGSLEQLIDFRFASYASKKKLFYISTPELEEKSNIYPVYLKGDQRKYYIPCPCCTKKITLEWKIESKKDGTKCGIIWDLDQNNELIQGSVRYRCQECNGEFDDSTKKDFLNAGIWIPTSKPKIKGYVSFHISALYAPIYMDNWEKYVNQYLSCCPPGGDRNEPEYKTFVNLVLGLPYKMPTNKLDSKKLMSAQRPYSPLIIPQSISESDGNGKIVMIIMSADVAGTELDSRIDYEIVAYSESGSPYSIDHGSVGTYQPREKNFVDRLRQPIDHTKENTVWNDFMDLMMMEFEIDNDPENKMTISAVGIDHAPYSEYMESFQDYYDSEILDGPFLFLLKGHTKEEKMKVNADLPLYKNSRSLPDRLFILNVNAIKTILSKYMGLIWRESDEKQPPNYMNFPTSTDGKYSYTNFFSHFESEEMVIDSKTFMYVWRKRKGGGLNHQFDCRVYNIAVREIFINEVIFKPIGIKKGNWSDYVQFWKNN